MKIWFNLLIKIWIPEMKIWFRLLVRIWIPDMKIWLLIRIWISDMKIYPRAIILPGLGQLEWFWQTTKLKMSPKMIL